MPNFSDEPGLRAELKEALWFRAIEVLDKNGMQIDPEKHRVAEAIREVEDEPGS
jgi:hypothetical protein